MLMTALLAWTALQGSVAASPAPTHEAHEQGRSAESFIAQGLLMYRRLQFQQARKEFAQAVETDPSNAAAHFYLGYTLYKIGEPTRRLTPEKIQAREEFARCFELDRSFRPVW